MKSKEFVLWLKGFTDGVHEYNITPKQWDLLKERLSEVDDDYVEQPGTFEVHKEPAYPSFPFGTPNTYPPYPPYDPYNPFKVTCSSGSFGTEITTTPGTTGYITIANPYIASFATGSYYNPSTTTTWYPSGSNRSYTNYQPFTTQTDNDLRIKKIKKRKKKSVEDWENEIDLGNAE